MRKERNQAIRYTIQIWVVTHHQCRISALFSQRSFREETSGGGFAKRRLFCQASFFLFANRISFTTSQIDNRPSKKSLYVK